MNNSVFHRLAITKVTKIIKYISRKIVEANVRQALVLISDLPGRGRRSKHCRSAGCEDIRKSVTVLVYEQCYNMH